MSKKDQKIQTLQLGIIRPNVAGLDVAGLLLSNGILNPAVAIAMGEAGSPALLMTVISGIAFGLLFSLFERAETKD